MPVWKPLLALCLGVLALLSHDPVRAETALAALDWQRPAPDPLERDVDCLALNIYWEARSELLLGQLAVASVTLNRVAAPAFPNSVCDVVFQGEERGRHLCQFSWRCDGLGDRPRNFAAWQEARRVARLALSRRVPDPTGGALWYHADHVLPAWTGEMTMRARIGHHLFYGRRPHVELRAQLAPGQEEGRLRQDTRMRAVVLRHGGIDASPATPDARNRYVPPSPKKPRLKIGLAVARPATKASTDGLRIDFEHDPAGRLVLCEDEARCGKVELQPAAMGGLTAATPLVDDQLMRALEPSLGARVPGAAHSPPATDESDVRSLALFGGLIERGARPPRGARPEPVELAVDLVQALDAIKGSGRAGQELIGVGGWHGKRFAGFIPHSLQATRYLAARSEPALERVQLLQALAQRQPEPPHAKPLGAPGGTPDDPSATAGIPSDHIGLPPLAGQPVTRLASGRLPSWRSAPPTADPFGGLASAPPALPG